MAGVRYAIAKQFSKTPGGREEGKRLFGILFNLLVRHDRIEVILDGTAGYASSFLDEAFGALPAHKIDFVSIEASELVSEIHSYMQN